jgi:small subunit ribosomal protein S6
LEIIVGMPLYESVFIARQDISAQQVDTLSEGFAGLIKENGGDVAKTEYWGVRSLAYRIKKNRKGHYVLMNLDAPADAVSELERNMRINEDILRYMTVRVDELEEGPSAVMQARTSRTGRGRDRDGGGRDRDGGGRDRDGGGRDRGGRDRGPREAATASGDE